MNYLRRHKKITVAVDGFSTEPKQKDVHSELLRKEESQVMQQLNIEYRYRCGLTHSRVRDKDLISKYSVEIKKNDISLSLENELNQKWDVQRKYFKKTKRGRPKKQQATVLLIQSEQEREEFGQEFKKSHDFILVGCIRGVSELKSFATYCSKKGLECSEGPRLDNW